MSPWTILAWVVLAAVYMAVCAGAWLIGSFRDWPDWLVPAVGAGVVALAFLFALIRKLLTPSGAAAPVAPGMQALTPGMAALMPPRELAKRWRDFLPLLGTKSQPLFLALGGDDAVRRRLWLSTPECRYLKDEASGLAFVVYPDSIWLDVSAAFVAPPAPEPGAPAAAAGSPGLWEELVRFLPEIPGAVRGVAAFVDAAQEAEAAARTSQWLAGKLDGLYAGQGKHAPALWIVSTGLESFPGGGRLVEKIAFSGDGGRALLGEAVGALCRNGRERVSVNSFFACLEELKGSLGEFIISCDATGVNDALSPEIHLVRDSLPALIRNAQTLCEAVAHGGRAKAAPLGGIFLCGGGDAVRGLAFGAAIPRIVVPEQARRAVRGKPRKTLCAAACLVLIALAAGLGFLYVCAREFIDAIPFHLLEASPNPGGFGGAPPIARYARARAELDALGRSFALTRTVYSAPDRALGAAEHLFAINLASWLPASDDPGLVDVWLDGLEEWAETRKGVSPLVFATVSGKQVARVRGAHGKAGRTATAKLLAGWRPLLDRASRETIDLLQSRYDARLHADWRRKGVAVLDTMIDAAVPGDFAVTKDFLASDPGFAFVAKAGEELDFSGTMDSEWGTAAAVAVRVMKDVPGENEPPETLDNATVAARRMRDYRDVLAALHPRSRDETALSDLAADTYSPPGGNPPPPSLIDADGAWGALSGALRALEPSFATAEGGDVLELLRSRYTLLHRAAMIHAANRIQYEWEETVLMPLAHLSADDAIVFMLDNKPHDVFAKAFAKNFLVIRNQGRHPARALGQDFPFNSAAIEWINRAESAVSKLDGEYPVRLTLLPVTVGKSARIFPRGINFTQVTTKDPVAATGYNNKVQAAFTWSARTCSDVELSIQFDTFTLRKTYPGTMGFLHFLKSLNKGKLILPSAAFPEGRKEMERHGVNFLHVNFEVSDPKGAATLDAEIQEPPTMSVQSPLFN